MALTVCPECNGKISTSSEHCVHCGCRLIFCPECGNAMVAGTKLCPECGASLETSQGVAMVNQELKEEPKAAPTKAAEEKKPDVVELHSSWKSANSIYSVMSVAGSVLDGIGGVMFIFAVLSSIAPILKFLLGGLAVVLCVVNFALDSICEYNKYKSVIKHAERKGFTTGEIVKVGMLEDPESKGIIENVSYSGKIRIFAEASYYSQQPEARTKEVILGAVRSVFMYIYTVLLTFFVHANFKNLDDVASFFERWPNVFNPALYSGFGLLVAAIVFIVINRILSRMTKKIIKEREEWIKDEYSGIYEEGYSEYLQ